MGLLSQLKQEYKTLSIVGMAKNAGKTTTLNYLIEEAMDDGVVLGITSTGRDGESTDLVTGTDKPRVFLDAGTIVSVPVKLYELADAGLEILRMTNYSTALGQMMLCRVAESGYVQIAGPVNTKDHKKMCQEMIDLGAELILIDGAVDRKSIAAPETSDAIILATGAVLSRSLKKVVEETVHILSLYRLPELEPGVFRDAILSNREAEKIMLMKQGKIEVLDLKTGLSASRFLDEAIDEETEYIYMPGAFTMSVIADIHPAKLKNVQFILKDPTKIFMDALPWQQLRKKGFSVKVLDHIEVAALTVNPYSPAGYSFEHEELLKAMRDAVEDIPVFDVKVGGGV
ncbi:hypothetical protein [Sinanaerobacter chloroacetimidivorans]|uniref:Uncharacterized protein n=1 Tax=Sinanaerobacter chloroacetimidivorans TaxID=2818044 RepID=A0A8J7W713_9FIRM|nr:hypothetical protein [Sinanaerobacter chloroacetimidivorans]MBR0600166.1 hypothetical protein [Sinanaerobacter chloroacetimidivorans]